MMADAFETLPSEEMTPLTASTADRHALYELSVQQPEIVIGLIEDYWLDQGEVLSSLSELREDFCGTAYLASSWVRSSDDRCAVGVDIDASVIAYAESHHRAWLSDTGEADRLSLVTDDVMACDATADVVTSLNFSHLIYDRYVDLKRYLSHMAASVRPGGMVMLDVYGGPAAMTSCCDQRVFGDFTYEWEQVSYDPTSDRVLNHIHFRFPDGTAMERAFTYTWRLWSVATLAEALDEIGLSSVEIWFESEEGFVTGDASLAESIDAWVAYIIARRPADG